MEGVCEGGKGLVGVAYGMSVRRLTQIGTFVFTVIRYPTYSSLKPPLNLFHAMRLSPTNLRYFFSFTLTRRPSPSLFKGVYQNGMKTILNQIVNLQLEVDTKHEVCSVFKFSIALCSTSRTNLPRTFGCPFTNWRKKTLNTMWSLAFSSLSSLTGIKHSWLIYESHYPRGVKPWNTTWLLSTKSRFHINRLAFRIRQSDKATKKYLVHAMSSVDLLAKQCGSNASSSGIHSFSCQSKVVNILALKSALKKIWWTTIEPSVIPVLDQC